MKVTSSNKATTVIGQKPCKHASHCKCKLTLLSKLMDTSNERPAGHKRLLIVLSVLAYVVVGLPVWWYTTRIPRPTLPHAAMQDIDRAWSTRGDQILLPVSIHVYLMQEAGTGLDLPALPQAVYTQLQKLLPAGSAPIHEVNVVHESGADCQSASMTPLLANRAGSPAAGAPCLKLGSAIANKLKSRQAHQHQHDQSHQQAQQPNAALSDMLVSQQDPDLVDIMLHQALVEAGLDSPGQYYVFVLPGGPSQGHQLVVGQHRHIWMWAGDTPSDSSNAATDIHVCKNVSSCLMSLAVPAVTSMLSPRPGTELIETAKQLPVSAAGDAVLLFTLANAPNSTSKQREPEQQFDEDTNSTIKRSPQKCARHYSWDFDEFEVAHIEPLISQLAPVMNFRSLSQVRLHASTRVTPAWSQQYQAYILRPDQLPFFVDSDWSLDFGLDASIHNLGSTELQQTAQTCASGLSSSSDCDANSFSTSSADEWHVPPSIVHFVLYAPLTTQQPLRIMQSDGSLSVTNSFWIPSWGGVHILPHNPRQDSAELADAPVGGDTRSGVSNKQHAILDDNAMYSFASSVIGQLRLLCGLNSVPSLPNFSKICVSSCENAVDVLPADTGIASWELDAMLRARAVADITSAARILGSLSRLTQTLHNLAMPDIIGQHVSIALAAIDKAASSSDYLKAMSAARLAHASAEASFSHPAILAQLSFPDSHKVGVYMPFFLPAFLPIVAALLQEVKRRFKRRSKDGDFSRHDSSKITEAAGGRPEEQDGTKPVVQASKADDT